MESAELKSIVEALIFVSDEPITVGALTIILEQDAITKADIETAISGIRLRYNEDPSTGMELREVAGGYQFRTKPHIAAYVQRLNIPRPSKLSQPALETLAIIAYRQPMVRSEIEDIRGVDTGGVLKTLVERSLIKIIGKRDEPGNPLIYGTTSKFLELFDLKGLKDLPTLREYEELEKERYGGGLLKKQEFSEAFLSGIDTTPISEKWSEGDDHLLAELDNNIKKLKKLEKDIFPKPVETLVVVPKEPVGVPDESENFSGAALGEKDE